VVTITTKRCGKEECTLPAQFMLTPANSPDDMTYHCCTEHLAEGVRLMVEQDPEGIVLVCLEDED
jgi:hypothetical protein